MNSAAATTAGLRFVQIDTATARELVSRGVSEGAVRLFAHLHVHAKQTGESRASHRYLAEELGKSVRTVRLYLRQLREAGAIRGRRTGRASGYQVAALTGKGLQFRAATCCSSDLERERERKERVVRTPPPPAETAPAAELTTPSLLEEEEEQPPDRSAIADLRDQLATATEREAEWRETAPEAPERRQAASLRRYLSTRLAWHEDVRRVAEAVQDLPGWRGWRGHGGVRNLEDLWRIRAEQARMPSDTWRRSCLRWCAHHTRHRGRLGDLRGWLLRERYEETEPPPRIPPDLPPPPPPAADLEATETAYTLWRCADPSAPACSFWRAGTEAAEEPPRCPHCGTPGVAT